MGPGSCEENSLLLSSAILGLLQNALLLFNRCKLEIKISIEINTRKIPISFCQSRLLFCLSINMPFFDMAGDLMIPVSYDCQFPSVAWQRANSAKIF